MDGISIRDEISEELAQRLYALRDTGPLMQRVGGAVQRAIRRHFAEIADDGSFHTTAEGLGADATGVYEDAAKSTTLEVSGSTATITVHDRRAAHRYYGGTISPRNGKFLAIPDTALAYGVSPRAFGNQLEFAMARNKYGRWQACLTLMDTTTKQRRALAKAARKAGYKANRWAYDESPVQYWLVRHPIYQQGNPEVMPSHDELRDAAVEAAEAYLAR